MRTMANEKRLIENPLPETIISISIDLWRQNVTGCQFSISKPFICDELVAFLRMVKELFSDRLSKTNIQSMTEMKCVDSEMA